MPDGGSGEMQPPQVPIGVKVNSEKPPKPSNWLLGGIAVYLMVVATLSGIAFVSLWPGQVASPGTSASVANITLLTVRFSISTEVQMIGLVLTAGAIGSVTYGLYAEFVHIARNDFNKRWTLWYFARPFVGAFFGLIFYLALRAGLFSIGSPVSQLNVFGFSALAALVGMFQEETLAKFKLIAESMLTKASFLREDHLTGENVPESGLYAFVKHVPGSTCKEAHQGLVLHFSDKETFTTPDCNQASLWRALGSPTG